MSSLLGVWQSVPYLFADLWAMLTDTPDSTGKVDTKGSAYRSYLVFLAIASVVGLTSSFVRIQMVYAILGALFIPMLALTLLLLNGRSELVGRTHRNRLATSAILVATLAMFLGFGVMEWSAWF
jgi:hypothetical protein